MSPDFYHITDDLLVKYLLGEANEVEQQLVDEWLQADSANQKQLEDLRTIWEESRKLAVRSTVDTHKAWLRFQQRIRPEQEKKGILLPARFYPWLRVAAVIILIIGTSLISYFLLNQKEQASITLASRQLVQTDTLPDGSIITLNKQSSVVYPSEFKKNHRTVALTGEAFFSVVPDKSKPFIVEVNDVIIRVIGTSFNVRTENGVTEVIVETGVVQVTSNNKALLLQAGEQARIDRLDSILVKSDVQDKLYNYYRSKEFVCDDTPLWKLVEVLKEAYGVDIVIAKNELRNLKLNTTFYNESLQTVLDVVAKTFDLSVIEEKDRIILK